MQAIEAVVAVGFGEGGHVHVGYVECRRAAGRSRLPARTRDRRPQLAPRRPARLRTPGVRPSNVEQDSRVCVRVGKPVTEGVRVTEVAPLRELEQVVEASPPLGALVAVALTYCVVGLPRLTRHVLVGLVHEICAHVGTKRLRLLQVDPQRPVTGRQVDGLHLDAPRLLRLLEHVAVQRVFGQHASPAVPGRRRNARRALRLNGRRPGMYGEQHGQRHGNPRGAKPSPAFPNAPHCSLPQALNSVHPE